MFIPTPTKPGHAQLYSTFLSAGKHPLQLVPDATWSQTHLYGMDGGAVSHLLVSLI